MIKYHQTTGELSQFNKGTWTHMGTGYSGVGEGLNNHAKEDVVNLGPLPTGLWSLGFPFKHATKGPLCFRLVPLTYKGLRSGFLIHGDNSTPAPNDASNGCIILNHDLRQKLADAKEDYLLVEL